MSKVIVRDRIYFSAPNIKSKTCQTFECYRVQNVPDTKELFVKMDKAIQFARAKEPPINYIPLIIDMKDKKVFNFLDAVDYLRQLGWKHYRDFDFENHKIHVVFYPDNFNADTNEAKQLLIERRNNNEN